MARDLTDPAEEQSAQTRRRRWSLREAAQYRHVVGEKEGSIQVGVIARDYYAGRGSPVEELFHSDTGKNCEKRQTNLAMLENLFAPLEAVAKDLQYLSLLQVWKYSWRRKRGCVAKDLQHLSLLQGTKAYGVHIEPFPVPARERWVRHQHENFYWLQQDYVCDRQLRKHWHWTVRRPQLILGEWLGVR